MYRAGIDDLNPETWVIHKAFSPDVDFCTWVLEVDGLQVPPFDKHQAGNEALRARGMDAESWQFWLKRVVLLSDQRLNWRVEDSSAELSTRLNSIEHTASEVSMRYSQLTFPDANNPALVGAVGNYIVWKEQQYQQAAAAVRQVYQDLEYPTWCPFPPHELWHGSLRVKQLLQELWQQYSYAIFSTRQEQWLLKQTRSSRISDSALYEALKPYHTKLAALQLYLVAYPTPIEHLIAPVSAILSINDTESVLRAVQGLAEA